MERHNHIDNDHAGATPSIFSISNDNSTKASMDKEKEKEDPAMDVQADASASASALEPSKPKSLKFKLTVFFFCLVILIASMDAVIVAACLAAIAEDLKSTSIQSIWVGTSFLLAQAVTIPLYETTSEVFGHKWLILIAPSIFTSGSILCNMAQSVTWLIGARVV